MPEWLVERGIGESRFARVKHGQIVEARILVDGIVPAGTEVEARLKRSGFQFFAEADRQDYLLPEGAPGISDGAALKVEIIRERIPGAEPWKRPLARLIHGSQRLVDQIEGRDLPAGSINQLDDAGWEDLIEEARSGIVRFDGGELRIWPTPAMTLIDVDGTLPPEKLAIHAAYAAATAILRLNIGGSIGIDFPTIKGKSERAAIASALDECLPKPFERTTLNGFGFLQIVRPRRHASLIELAQDRPAFEARALLRRIPRERTGPTRLVAHPAVVAILERQSEWTATLSRQVGGSVTLRSDPSLPIHGAYAESV